MALQQVEQLMTAIHFHILGQPYQFAAYFAAHWRNFLARQCNPQFVFNNGTRGACFDTNMTGQELAQLRAWRHGRVPDNLRTTQILYLDRQRRNLQQLVEYWDAQFVPIATTAPGIVSTGSQSGGATLGPGFTRSQEFQRYRHVMTRPGGCPPPEIQLAAHLPRQYQSLASAVRSRHRATLRP